MSAGLVVLTLSMLLGIQPVTTDLYLPALPGLAKDLAAPMSQTHLTLTALLLSFGLSQLLWGPLSDRFGRKPILLCGLATYTLASIGAAQSASMEVLVTWRILQGAAMGAAVMGARAIVRDLYAPAQGATVMSKGLSGLAVIACISAPLGGLLTAHFSWHIALLALAVFGALAFTLVAWRFEETLATPKRDALHPAALVKTWWQIVRNPVFLAFSCLSVTSYAGLFTFLAASSFVFIQVLGLSTTEYGLCVLLNSMVYLCGTILCRRLVARLGVRRTVAVAACLSLSAAIGLLALRFAGFNTVWAIMGPMVFFMLGHGVHQPCSQSGAVGPFPQAAGTASALNGFLMMFAVFFMGRWLGGHMDGTAAPLIHGIAVWCLLIAGCAWTLVRRYAPT